MAINKQIWTRKGSSASSTDTSGTATLIAPDVPERESERKVQTIPTLVEQPDPAIDEKSRGSASQTEELIQIGIALSAQRDLDSLLRMILQKAREITKADAGSLYLIEEFGTERRLRFKLTQNDSVDFRSEEVSLPLTQASMAGYTALHGEAINLRDAYHIPRGKPYSFNDAFDRKSGYRTRSMLTLPMRNARGEILGVLQLINRKRRFEARLANPLQSRREVEPFPQSAVRLASSLASQAAVAYENSKLYKEIQALFEGLVTASVTAIEQRDPATYGHSSRVAILTMGLADAVNAVTTGAYANVHFTAEQMREIRYATLLHDFGKVGVREEVLVKEKKLYPSQLEMIRFRFGLMRRELETETHRRKTEMLLNGGQNATTEVLEAMDQELAEQILHLEDDLRFILKVNEPSLLPTGAFDRVAEVAKRTYSDLDGKRQPCLTEREIQLLSIPKGSLDEDERRQIESHVDHTHKFLSQIPWTRELAEIPSIARAHHEKLNGSGYPRGLKDAEIPLASKMMSICDIFDALHAADRPYKAAVPLERALRILEECVRDNQLDAELFRLFVEAKVYELTEK